MKLGRQNQSSSNPSPLSIHIVILCACTIMAFDISLYLNSFLVLSILLALYPLYSMPYKLHEYREVPQKARRPF